MYNHIMKLKESDLMNYRKIRKFVDSTSKPNNNNKSSYLNYELQK